MKPTPKRDTKKIYNETGAKKKVKGRLTFI
jgi:hypothetical protein